MSEGEAPRVTEMRNLAGLRAVEIWATDVTPQLPTTGDDPTVSMTAFIPPPGGTRLRIVSFPPDARVADLAAQGAIDLPEGGAEFAAAAPDLAATFEAEHPGMHTTTTIDYNLVLSGEIWCELDDGAMVQLRAGDCLVQCGTRHGWRNKSDETCVMASMMVGGVGQEDLAGRGR
jgi:hypothetical protein